MDLVNDDDVICDLTKDQIKVVRPNPNTVITPEILKSYYRFSDAEAEQVCRVFREGGVIDISDWGMWAPRNIQAAFVENSEDPLGWE